MIKYFKNENSVIKVDMINKKLIFCIINNNFYIIRQDNSLSAYNFVTGIKYNEGKFIDATEEEFLNYKTQCLNSLF